MDKFVAFYRTTSTTTTTHQVIMSSQHKSAVMCAPDISPLSTHARAIRDDNYKTHTHTHKHCPHKRNRNRLHLVVPNFPQRRGPNVHVQRTTASHFCWFSL